MAMMMVFKNHVEYNTPSVFVTPSADLPITVFVLILLDFQLMLKRLREIGN